MGENDLFVDALWNISPIQKKTFHAYKDIQWNKQSVTLIHTASRMKRNPRSFV